jgi:twitching motility two-component system response regulator PilG
VEQFYRIGKHAEDRLTYAHDLETSESQQASMSSDQNTDSGAEGDTDLNGLKILLIDDSRTIRRSAETMLSREGCEVITANDGFEALSLIHKHEPNLIFVDIMMPRLDGYQTCAIIKNNARFKSVPVVMLTSKDGLFDKARGRIVGSDHYLTKPFTRDELLSAVREQISRMEAA